MSLLQACIARANAPCFASLCGSREELLTGLCKGAFSYVEGRKRLLSSVKLLLDAGADPFLGDEFNTEPLHYAMQGAGTSKDSRMVELLFDAMYPNGHVRGMVRTNSRDHPRFIVWKDKKRKCRFVDSGKLRQVSVRLCTSGKLIAECYFS